jgi:hypothetical protein
MLKEFVVYEVETTNLHCVQKLSFKSLVEHISDPLKPAVSEPRSNPEGSPCAFFFLSIHCTVGTVLSWSFPIDDVYPSVACRYLKGQTMSTLVMLSILCPLVQNTLEFTIHLMIIQGYCMKQVGHSNTISRLVAIHLIVSDCSQACSDSSC